MSIVFDEIIAEIVPDRQTVPAEEKTAETAPPDNLAEKIRQELALLQERSARLRAD